MQQRVSEALVNDRKRILEELDDLQQYGRRTNILIHGVPEESSEKTDNKALYIINNKLGISGVTIDHLSRSHRLGKKHEGKKRPIIVRFTSYRRRKMVFDVKKKLKGTGITVTENLSKYPEWLSTTIAKNDLVEEIAGHWTGKFSS